MKKFIFILATMLMCLMPAHIHAQVVKVAVRSTQKAAIAGAVASRAIMATRQTDIYRYRMPLHSNMYVHSHILTGIDSIHPRRQLKLRTEYKESANWGFSQKLYSQEKSLKDSKSMNIMAADKAASNTVSEKSSLPEDKDTGRYGFIIYGGLGLGVILILGFIAFMIYDNYHVPAVKTNYTYTFPMQPKYGKTRIWYVNPAGEVKMSL